MLRRRMRHAEAATVEDAWLCRRAIPADRLPVVGWARERLYVVATHSGVTLAPALAELVASEVIDGAERDELAERIGVATNNVAEYQALLRGVERARDLGATEVEIVNDSELVAKQLTGAYKVKHPAMKPLHAEAIAALRRFDAWRVRSVPRAENARADELVNRALDGAL